MRSASAARDRRSAGRRQQFPSGPSPPSNTATCPGEGDHDERDRCPRPSDQRVTTREPTRSMTRADHRQHSGKFEAAMRRWSAPRPITATGIAKVCCVGDERGWSPPIAEAVRVNEDAEIDQELRVRGSARSAVREGSALDRRRAGNPPSVDPAPGVSGRLLEGEDGYVAAPRAATYARKAQNRARRNPSRPPAPADPRADAGRPNRSRPLVDARIIRPRSPTARIWTRTVAEDGVMSDRPSPRPGTETPENMQRLERVGDARRQRSPPAMIAVPGTSRADVRSGLRGHPGRNVGDETAEAETA